MRSVVTYPTIPMARFGVNPYSEPLYRIVFSDTRTDMIGGKWPDGVCEYREVPRYPAIRGKWVLERWIDPETYAGTEEQYAKAQIDSESNLLTCGPYPRRGEFAYVETFIANPTDATVSRMVGENRLSRGLTPGQRKQGIMDPLEKQQHEQDQRFSDIWDESMGPWQKADAVVSFAGGHVGSRQGFKRGADMPLERFDQSSPLPTRDGFFGTIQRQETIDKLTGE